MTVLFASDVHLSAQRPAQVAHFLAFIAGPCRHASALYLLGDLFDEWLGDDDERDPHPLVVEALAELSDSGVPVSVCHGNHDFLTGDAFAARTGCTLLREATSIDVYGTRVVVLHGDELCTRDEGYQQWRATFMNPANQQGFLALDFDARLARAAALRHESATLTRLKTDDIMDVTESAALDLLRAHGARHMVHGHTHRPALHRIDVDGQPGLRAVLGDWYSDDQVIRWDADGPQLLSAQTLMDEDTTAAAN